METNNKILLADDHVLFTEGLLGILQKNFPAFSFEVVESGDRAWSAISNDPTYNLVITDISMPGMNGIELTTKIKQTYPYIKVLVLSMHNEREMVRTIVDSEAEGYVLKNSTARDIISAVKDILDGNTHYGREVLNVILQKIQIEKKKEEARKLLTDREIEVLRLIVAEHSSEEIGDKLFISKRTVDTHRSNILEKTGCRNIIALIKYAIRHEIVIL